MVLACRRCCCRSVNRDLAGACLVIVLNEPVDRLLESLLERRELELFVILARLAHELN